MNIDENYFNDTLNKFEIIKIIDNKYDILINDINTKFLEYNNQIQNLLNSNNILNQKIQILEEQILNIPKHCEVCSLENKIKSLQEKIDILEKTIANINKNSFIESYRNLRKGISFPYSNILSKDLSLSKYNNSDHID
jgi:hypothetical protein